MNVLAQNAELTSFKTRIAGERMLACMAVADIYGKQAQFLKRSTESFSKNPLYDFTHGKYKLAVVPGTVNDKFEQTGSKVRFRFSSRLVTKDHRPNWILLVAINMPNIQIIGWIHPEDAVSHIKGYTATIFAGDPKIKPVNELPLENKRVKGLFI